MFSTSVRAADCRLGDRVVTGMPTADGKGSLVYEIAEMKLIGNRTIDFVLKSDKAPFGEETVVHRMDVDAIFSLECNKDRKILGRFRFKAI